MASNSIEGIWGKLKKTTFFRETLSGATLSILVALVGICIVFSIASKYFFTFGNFESIGLYASIIGVMGAGATVVMLMAGLDLSQHAVAALTTVLTTTFTIGMGLPLGASLLLVMLCSLICGLFNGVLIAVFRMPPMIATMGSQYIIRSLCYVLSDAKTILFKDATLEFIGRGSSMGIPNSIIIMAVVFLVLSYVLNKTIFGRKVYAVGSNERASFLSGISPVKTKLIAYMISALCSAIAGVITVSQVGAAVPSSGTGSEMEIIASVFLGGVTATGGKGSLFGTFLGIIVICAINNGLTLMGVQSYYQSMMRGVVILIAVFMDTLRMNRARRI